MGMVQMVRCNGHGPGGARQWPWGLQGEKYMMPEVCLRAVQDGEAPGKGCQQTIDRSGAHTEGPSLSMPCWTEKLVGQDEITMVVLVTLEDAGRLLLLMASLVRFVRVSPPQGECRNS
ncbi:hypothetical protein WJX74_003301 [Apatococcus lobatus]|uniref:Uncharacterized protein n=1 Tax=Apatococcus lobatus TaxID=904363 RepID=A0AAW1RZG1_9CHLO